jgi:phage baseplate assembly protein gpV
MNAWLDILRREAGVVAGQRRAKSTLVVTSYNPNKHAVKGTLQPYGVETGWIPVGAIGVGSNYGVLVGPNIGDQFSVEFENGDPNSPIATHRLFSSQDTPPVVQSGEILIMSAFSHKITLTKDQKLVIFSQGDMTVQTAGTLNVIANALNLN